MTKEEMAALLDGRQYRNEMTAEEEAEARHHGLLVVFGASDDLMEFRGAFDDEVGCFDGGLCLIDANGRLDNLLLDMLDDDHVAKYLKRKQEAKLIEACWCDTYHDYSWTYRTHVPHAEFDIMDGDVPYCRGIVIDVRDLKAEEGER